MSACLVIRSVPYDHPDASAMTEALQDYYRSLYHGPDRSPVDPAEFTPPSGRFFVGYLEGVAVAMGGWRWIEPLTEMGAARPVEIKRMYVDANTRGRGYARTLLGHLETTAKAAGADAVVLATGQPQRDAIALYRSQSYDDVPRFGFFAPYETAVHLGKWLTATADEGEANGRPADGTAR
jgi:GNAT superfamily N-acetyltransferase